MEWMIFEGWPMWAVILFWLVTVIALLYFARLPFRQAVIRLTRLLTAMLRINALALSRMADQLQQRNREVLLEMGKSHMERRLSRNFHRVSDIVANDLGHYPELQKSISRLVAQLEEDYHQSAETTPPSPDWIEALEAIVKLKEAQKGNPVIVKILEDLYSSLETQQKKTLDTYREGVSARHRLLHAMMPHWRKLNNAVERVGGSMKNLIMQADEIDRNMDRFREIDSASDRAARMLQVSFLKDFITSGLWVSLFALFIFVDYQLIALPVAELVGTRAQIGSYAVADVAALVMVLTVVVVGMLLMEVLHITQMFPAFGSLDERKRRLLFWSLSLLVFVLAGIGSALAYMQNQMMVQSAQLSSILIGGEPVLSEGLFPQIFPQTLQMLIGFILPFVLLFFAIPFETLIESGRILLANLVVQLLRLVSMLVRLVAALIRYLCDVLLSLYDIVVSMPLWLESRFRASPAAEPPQPAKDANSVTGDGTP